MTLAKQKPRPTAIGTGLEGDKKDENVHKMTSRGAAVKWPMSPPTQYELSLPRQQPKPQREAIDDQADSMPR